jgi:hypothetical protein
MGQIIFDGLQSINMLDVPRPVSWHYYAIERRQTERIRKSDVTFRISILEAVKVCWNKRKDKENDRTIEALKKFVETGVLGMANDPIEKRKEKRRCIGTRRRAPECHTCPHNFAALGLTCDPNSSVEHKHLRRRVQTIFLSVRS